MAHDEEGARSGGDAEERSSRARHSGRLRVDYARWCYLLQHSERNVADNRGYRQRDDRDRSFTVSGFQQDRGHQIQSGVRSGARAASSLHHCGEQHHDRRVRPRRRFCDARLRSAQRGDTASRRARRRKTRDPSAPTGENCRAASASVEVREIFFQYSHLETKLIINLLY